MNAKKNTNPNTKSGLELAEAALNSIKEYNDENKYPFTLRGIITSNRTARCAFSTKRVDAEHTIERIVALAFETCSEWGSDIDDSRRRVNESIVEMADDPMMNFSTPKNWKFHAMLDLATEQALELIEKQRAEIARLKSELAAAKSDIAELRHDNHPA